MIRYVLLALLLSMFTCSFAKEKPLEIILTIDDLPAAGTDHPNKSRLEIAQSIIEALKKNNIKQVYGFINGILITNMEERDKIMRLWKQAGHLVGNHTYSHKDLTKVSAQEYIDDIEKNESTLIDYANNINELKVFRYPYLQEGESQEKRYAIRSYLFRRNYKIAPVSVDFEDWIFSEAYIRCLKTNNQEAANEIKAKYLENAVKRLKFSDELAKYIYGHRIKQIVLLHITSLTAEMLPLLISEYKKQGVQFISLDKALKERIYNEDTAIWSDVGESFLIQTQKSRKLNPKDIIIPPIDRKSFEKMCT